MARTPAWQRAEGKNPEGGLNAKGRAAYNRANPGKPGLKRPQPEGGSRRDSFCARMKGMKKKLTSAETARDPNSRINKSLRAWNCAEGGMIKKYSGGGEGQVDYNSLIQNAISEGDLDKATAYMEAKRNAEFNAFTRQSPKQPEQQVSKPKPKPKPKPKISPEIPKYRPEIPEFYRRTKGFKNRIAEIEAQQKAYDASNKYARGGMIKKYAKGGLSTAEGRGKPEDLRMAKVDRRMAELDKYLKDPNLEMVIGPTGKFQFREKKKSAATPSRPKTPVAPPRPPASPRTKKGSSGARPLSAFGPKGERQQARPLDKPSNVKLRDTSKFVPAEARRAQEKIDKTRNALDMASFAVPALGAAGLGLRAAGRYGTRMLDKGIRKLSRRNLLTPEKMSSALARTRPGEPVPSIPGASSALRPSGRSEYASSPLNADRTRKALAALRRGEITPEEALQMVKGLKKGGRVKAKPAKVATVMREYKAGKLHSGKSKKIVRNPKQAVAIALSKGRKAARKK